MSPTPDTPAAPVGFNLVAGLAAAIIPGAGHLVLGEKKRAALIATGVLGLFFGGILIGGIDVIDSREDRVWFFGQAMVGPIAFGVDYIHQNRFKGVPSSYVEGLPGSRRTTEAKLAEGRAMIRSAAPDEVRRVEPVSVAGRMVDVPILDVPVGIPASFFEGSPGSLRTSEERLVLGRRSVRSPNTGEVVFVERVTIATSDGKTRVEELPIVGAPTGKSDNGAEGPPNIKSLSKVNELGTLFATIAGMLNVIVIVDALMPGRRKD